MADNFNSTRTREFTASHFLIRFVVGVIMLAVTAALTPGFSISGIWPLLISALLLAGLDYLTVKFFGVNATPFGRGITGFILAAVILYVTKFFVAGYDINMLGAVLGALVYGIIDAIIPGRTI